MDKPIMQFLKGLENFTRGFDQNRKSMNEGFKLFKQLLQHITFEDSDEVYKDDVPDVRRFQILVLAVCLICSPTK